MTEWIKFIVFAAVALVVVSFGSVLIAAAAFALAALAIIRALLYFITAPFRSKRG